MSVADIVVIVGGIGLMAPPRQGGFQSSSQRVADVGTVLNCGQRTAVRAISATGVSASAAQVWVAEARARALP